MKGSILTKNFDYCMIISSFSYVILCSLDVLKTLISKQYPVLLTGLMHFLQRNTWVV